MLAALDRSDAELSVLLTDDRKIEALNRQYRDKARPTDVLSFHFEPMGAPAPLEAGWLLGDIVISLDTAARQAQGRKRPLDEEVRWLLAHGLLHLVGYDHATAEDKRVMVNWTQKLVRAAGAAPELVTSKTSRVSPSKKRAAKTTPRVSPSKKRAAKTTPRVSASKKRAVKTRAPNLRAATRSLESAPLSTPTPHAGGSKRRSVARVNRRSSPQTTSENPTKKRRL
jgi:probable rRNA maturation factor